MKIIRPSHEILFLPDGNAILKLIELAGRTCYKSEDMITEDSAKKFAAGIIRSGHHSVIEHVNLTVRFVCDRGISHELVRHRLASYSQESTRYVSSVNTKDEVIETEQEVIDLYRSGMSMRRISELSKGKFTEWDVYKILDANDIERRPLGNTGVTNYTFFDSIDTPEKAYLLGVIQADGSVRGGEGSPQISITQHEDFAWYLHRMVTDFIRPTAKANKDKRCRQITFTSPKLRDALVSLGIVPNKSYDQTDADADKLWMAIPDQLKPSFLRGFLDGDGGIRFFKQNNAGQTDSCNIYWLGHRHLLEHIAAWLDEKFDYEPEVKPVPGTKHLHRVVVTNPHIGDKLVKLMLTDFKFPYGHPAKTARMIERVGGEYGYAEFGDPKFIVIEPEWINKDPTMKFLWLEAMDGSERAYSTLRMNGASPQQARSVLPNSLKTEIVMTCNLREWKHVFRMRCQKAAHPQIRELMLPLLKELHEKIPIVFDEEYEVFFQQ